MTLGPSPFEVEMDDPSMARCLTLRTIFTDVYKTLGKGYPEGVYQRATAVELQLHRIPFDLEVTMGIPYKGHTVGQIRADIILRDSVSVVIETKATAMNLKPEERWQLSRYMKILEIPLGVLVNFPQTLAAESPQIEFLVLIEGKIFLFDLTTNKVTELT